MNYFRPLLYCFVALLISGCGQTIKQSLKVPPADQKTTIGEGKTVVILPFADYSYADNVETAYRRNIFITENITDRLVSNSFQLPVQEDVFLYLVDQGVISLLNYNTKNRYSLEDELQNNWSSAMKVELQRYIEEAKRNTNKPIINSPGTHGLTKNVVAKIGHHFNADYVVRGRIIQYKTRQDPSWAPWKKGILTFITGVSSKLAFGQASTEEYDNLNSMSLGGALAGYTAYHNADWPWDNSKADQTILGVSGGADANAIVWGALGIGAGNLAHNSGDIPQAVVQLRIWVQDSFTGDVVWTNRVDVKVSPESVLADFQYDELYEKATEKAVATLISDFVNSGI